MIEEGLFISEATLGDVPELAEVEDQAFEAPWSPRALEAEVGRAEGLLLLLRGGLGRALKGYACWRLAADEAELLRVAVAPAHRRRGLARRILVHGLRRLSQQGIRTCFLEVRPDNEAARGLYASLGFRAVGLRPNYYRDGAPARLYSLDVPAPPSAGA